MKSLSFLRWRHEKKESNGYTGSTIRERNKKNAEYYVGDYFVLTHKQSILVGICEHNQANPIQAKNFFIQKLDNLNFESFLL